MQTTISNRIIRKLNPCYDPKEVIKDENEELPIKEWVAKYRNEVHSKKYIIWLLCHKLFMSDKNIRLFAVWCAREALKLVDNPDARSVKACDVSEKFANGKASEEDLYAAWVAAWSAELVSELGASRDAAWAAELVAARVAAWSSLDAAWDAQINELMKYF